MDKHLRHLLLLLFHTLKFTIIFYTLIILSSPIYLYRWILSKLHKKLYPENVGIVSPLSSTYIEYDGTLKSSYNIVANMKFSGEITIEKLIDRVVSKIINAKDLNWEAEAGKAKAPPRLLYPELQQYINIWYGYPFWYKNHKFDINKHIKSYEELINNNPTLTKNSTTRDEIFCNEFLTSYVQETLKPKQSPWEMIVINNVVQNSTTSSNNNEVYTLVVFKFQHCLADGYSIFNAIMKMADTEVPRYKPILPSKFQQTVAKICYPILAPIHMAQMLLESVPNTSWDKVKGPAAVNNERVYGKTAVFNMTEMKKISTANKVQFTSVLFGSLGNIIRNFMKKNGKDIPEYIQCGISIPTTNHPEGLANDWYFTSIRIPLKGKTQMDLINYVAKQIPQIKHSTLFVTRQVLHKLIFMLPIVWKWKLNLYELFYGSVKRPWPTLLSCMPGPKDTVFVYNNPLVEMNYIYNRAHGNPCLMTMLSYQNQFQFWFSIDSNITFGKGVDALMEEVNQQFESLDETLVNNLLN